MSEELSWSLPWRALRADQIRELGQQVAERYGAALEVELEDHDCVSAFFTVSAEVVARAAGEDSSNGKGAGDAGATSYVLELSFYDMDEDGCVLCVEPEWSDNDAAWDAACELGEAFAALVGAEPLDL